MSTKESSAKRRNKTALQLMYFLYFADRASQCIYRSN